MKGWCYSLIVGLALSLLSLRTAQADTPMEVQEVELSAHLPDPTRPPAFFSDESAIIATAWLRLTIDEQGRVVAAVPEPKGTPWSDRLLKYRQRISDMALGLQFRPFERDGKPVAVTGPMSIAVYPKTKPAADRPFAEASMAETDISLSRGPCEGLCPIYDVTIHGDGRVTFNGDFHTSIIGAVDYRVDPANVAALIEQFRAVRFFGLEDRYFNDSISDWPEARIRLRRGNSVKTVREYDGLAVGMPMSVIDIADAIDRLARSDHWISGGPEIVDELAASGWDFSRADFADNFACMTYDIYLRPGLLDAFLSHGTRPDGHCDGWSAMEIAARHGPVETFERLRATGVLKGYTPDQKNAVLMEAVSGGQLAMVEAMLREGADPAAPNEKGESALKAAERLASAPGGGENPERTADRPRIWQLLRSIAGAKP
ncbi:DUF6438 domain-containing protein [Zavarzinia sp.]|uniref:DUF6438 domain-containing protein n=1 Tax=Zavarzinia sp. TaxID=2027920 RepID=UPI003BB686B3